MIILSFLRTVHEVWTEAMRLRDEHMKKNRFVDAE
jgi:hypothetical protein